MRVVQWHGSNNQQKWEKDWQMKFNPDMCEIICIANKSEYTIHGQILRCTDKAKYLGVTTDSTLSWNHHIAIIMKKAYNTTALPRWNLSSYLSDVKDTCYNALVRPQLWYASCIWDPHNLVSVRLKQCSKE